MIGRGAFRRWSWDDVADAREICRAGEVVHVTGRFSVHPRFGPQLAVQHVRAAGRPTSTRAMSCSTGRRATPSRWRSDLRELIATVQNPHLRRLLGDRVRRGHADLGAATARRRPPSTTTRPTGTACSSTALTVAQAVGAISATFPGIDRDIAVTGALLHDIGKLEAYELAGRGDRDVRPTAACTARSRSATTGSGARSSGSTAFPADLEQALLHIILSHHGSLEHGSPVVPCTREATLVHMIDNLGGRLGSFDRLEKELPAGEQWSAYDKGIGGGAYFADRALEAEREAA